MLQRFWYDRTFRTQLLIAIGIINLCALMIAAMVSILNARQATRGEMDASLEIAKRFVRVTIQALSPDGGNLAKKIDQVSSHLQLARLRHVRIMVADAAGNLVQVSPRAKTNGEATEPTAPRWFSALVEPETPAHKLSVVLAEAGGTVLIVEQPLESVPRVWGLGTVVVAGEPADEIAEVWQDVSSLALVWLLLDALVLAVLYLVLGRMLDPLAGLARALLKLEDGDYNTRFTPPRIKELGIIAARFNQLAEVLGRARAENARLYGQLITVQEDERREIANELHDEASPCLFGIMANALSVERLAERRRDRKTLEIRGHVKEIVRITERLKMMNRVLLKKLRPVALGRVALAALVEDLIGELQRRYPEVALSQAIKTRGVTYGETIDLTVYRSVQEGVTNAIRHGKADTVKVELFEKRQKHNNNGDATKPTLQLLIQDDGRGILPETTLGFGLTLMRERINALGGSCAIQSAPSHGATLRVVIPINAVAAVKRRQIERIEAN